MSKLKIRKAIKNDSKDILFFINQLAKFEKLEDQVMANIEYLEKYIFDKEYVSNGYYYTYDDDWSVPGQLTTIEGAGYYPQATRNFLVGLTLKF